jgi:alcohol dehydrogenase, propanol-preferring
VTTMKAFRLLDWGKLGYDDVAVPAPRPGEVLVRLGGAGLCGSDLHFRHMGRDEWPSRPPWTLGHENAGWVERSGPGTGRFTDGEAVLATGIHSCGNCRACVRGDDNQCALVAGGRGAGADGGFAPFVVVPERELAPLGTLDPRTAAPLADAGHTPYSAVRSAVSRLTPDATAVVVGAGGLGSYAVQFIRLLTASRVVAVEPIAERRSRALALGADEAIPPGPDTAAAVRDLTGGWGADVVFDFVATQETMAAAAACAAPGGAIVLVGMHGGSLDLVFGRTPPVGCHLYWHMGGTMKDLFEVISLAQRGLLQIDVQHFAFDEIEAALARLEAGDLAARAVILPNG